MSVGPRSLAAIIGTLTLVDAARADVPPADMRACVDVSEKDEAAEPALEVADDEAPSFHLRPPGSACTLWFEVTALRPWMPGGYGPLVPSPGACGMGMCSRYVAASGRMLIDEPTRLDPYDEARNRTWPCYRCIYPRPSEPQDTPAPRDEPPPLGVALALTTLGALAAWARPRPRRR